MRTNARNVGTIPRDKNCADRYVVVLMTVIDTLYNYELVQNDIVTMTIAPAVHSQFWSRRALAKSTMNTRQLSQLVLVVYVPYPYTTEKLGQHTVSGFHSVK